jgi:hypothetical protein
MAQTSRVLAWGNFDHMKRKKIPAPFEMYERRAACAPEPLPRLSFDPMQIDGKRIYNRHVLALGPVDIGIE